MHFSENYRRGGQIDPRSSAVLESTDKRVKNVKKSAVSDHLLQCHCTIDFDHFDILASDTNNFRLLIKKSLLINRDKTVLNRTVKSFPLKLFE